MNMVQIPKKWFDEFEKVRMKANYADGPHLQVQRDLIKGSPKKDHEGDLWQTFDSGNSRYYVDNEWLMLNKLIPLSEKGE